MKRYSVTITATVEIPARDDQQAKERADELIDCFSFVADKRPQWAKQDGVEVSEWASAVEEEL